MATDPAHRGRGAASRLLAWGVARCAARGCPAYLESTLEAASFYQKRGFAPVEMFSLDISQARAGTGDGGGGGDGGVYSEISFVYFPAKTP